MAQTGYTPILIYSSSTASNAPAAGNLTNSALGSELAINITDGKLFYKDNSNAVQVIGWKVTPATAGGTGQTSYAVGDILYADTTTSLAKLADVATGNALISGGVGAAPSWGKIGLTTHVSGILGVGNGGTGQSSNLTQYGVIYGSTTTAMATTAAGTSTQVLHGNASGAPTWGAVSLSADVTGTLGTTNGGTGLTSFTNKGIPYASSTSALTTGTALGFDGTNLAVGTTDYIGGSVSNAAKILGGNFRTARASATIPASGTATVLTLNSSIAGTYIVSASFGAQGNQIYGGMAIVVANAGSFRLQYDGSGSRCGITLSGANVQITNALGIQLDATVSVLYIGAE